MPPNNIRYLWLDLVYVNKKYHYLNKAVETQFADQRKIADMNGWKRLFVMVCVLWAIAVIFYCLKGLENLPPTIEQSESNQTIPSGDSTYAFLSSGGKVPQEMQQHANQERRTLQIKLAKTTSTLFLLPLLLAYLIGWLTAWVRRGFAKRHY